MSQSNSTCLRSVYFVDGARTPFIKAKSQPGPFAASDLAVYAGRELLQRQPFSPDKLGEVIIGCMSPSEKEANIARVIALRLGCGNHVPAWTVQRNCASGLQAIDNAFMDIATGRHDLVLTGGTEAMSRAPLLFNHNMVKWLAKLNAAKTPGHKLKQLAAFKPSFLSPVISLLHGLTDPVCGLNMGHTAEKVVHRFGITREELDAFSVLSHQRVAAAHDAGYLNEIIPIFDNKGILYDADDGVRRDSSTEKLARLKPVFDKKYGLVTPGNSSQITDGACVILMASEDAVKKYQLPVLGKVTDVSWAGLDPTVMGLGPVHAITPLLQRHDLNLNDVDYYEINEAFAGQVLGCLRAWEDDEYCQQALHLPNALGSLDREKLNVDGGAIAIGHPVGSSGARITLHLLNTLKRQNARLGIASLCIGGGQGGAILVENVAGV